MGNLVPNDFATVIQSSLLRGEKIFQPSGHEFLSVDFLTLCPLTTLMSRPAEYRPFRGIFLTEQPLGLPSAHLTGVGGAKGEGKCFREIGKATHATYMCG